MTERSQDDLSRVRAVVFDVDGTLYEPRAMRRAMALRILGWLALHPWRVPEIQSLRVFRRLRESLADHEVAEIQTEQYRVAAEATGRTSAEIERVVDEWVHRRPLAILGRYRYPGVAELFDRLRTAGWKIAIWSDYRAEFKVQALDLRADLVVSAEDVEVNRMKPDPTGLRVILDRWSLEPDECLMIGDRDDRDGEAARRLGTPYRILGAGPNSTTPCAFADFAALERELAPRLDAIVR